MLTRNVANVRFGTFVVDLSSAEIYKQGRLIRLQHQPFELLRVLLEQPGGLVSRAVLQKRLWADGVTVDFDQSLNKSVTKLRDALGDTASNPRYIETVPKRGYRFIAPISFADAPLEPVSFAQAAPETLSELVHAAAVVPLLSAGAPTREPRAASRPLWLGAGLLIAIGATAALSVATVNSGSRVVANADRPAPRKVAASTPIYAARDAYERGRLALARRSQESLKVSVEHFQRAIALSPRFADAYVGLADSWSLSSSYGLVDPREGMPRARDAANRALTLAPGLAPAHASLARTTMIFDWDWTTAGWHFARAVELEPGRATTHQWHAYFLSAMARHDEAVEAARRAVAAEPLSLNTNTALGWVLYAARRYDEAASQLERTLEIDPDFALALRDLALVRVQQGRRDEALAGLQRVAALNGSLVARAELAWVHALAGRHATARRTLADLDRLRATTYVPPDSLALVYVGLGARDEAVAWLQRAFTMRVATLAHLPVDPVWDDLRDDPRVQQMTAAIRAGMH